MIVREFLQWLRCAGAAERAEATTALARAYLYSDLSTDDRAAAEGAIIMQLDDPSPLVREALSRRVDLPCAVSAAIAEVGSAEACLVLVENPSAEIVAFSLDRIVERHGHLAAIREAMLIREDLPAPTRQALVAKLSET